MKSTKIGYARCSTARQDLSAQPQALIELGVSEDRIYTDHGLTGANRARPGLDQAIVLCARVTHWLCQNCIVSRGPSRMHAASRVCCKPEA